MVFERVRKSVSKNDEGVSPVVGTILMVAATVAIGATVFAAMNAFGGETAEPPVDAIFTLKAVDTDSDGLTDVVRVTYTSGPDLAEGLVKVSIKDSSDPTIKLTSAATTAGWSVGDFRNYDLAATPSASAGSYLATIVIGETLVLEKTVALDE